MPVCGPQISTIKDAQLLNAMPRTCIVHKSSLPVLKSYREYFAYRSICKGYIDTSLVTDQTIRTFLNCMDHEMLFQLAKQIWAQEVM